jgi:GxxExxY protein
MDKNIRDAETLVTRVLDAAMAVHRATGPGLLESVYLRCLQIEFRAMGLPYRTQVPVPLIYRGVPLDSEFRLDALAGDRVIIEVKAVDRLHPVHTAQVVTYLKLMDVPLGLLINFNVSLLKNGVRRVEHPDIYRARSMPQATPESSSPACTGEHERRQSDD